MDIAIILCGLGVTLIEFPKHENQQIPSSKVSQQTLQSDYNLLKNLLISKDFREADHLTETILLNLTGGFWVGDGIWKIPCTDLRTINQLWFEYSNEKFGFGIQKSIFEESGRLLGGGSGSFEERVGWYRNYNWVTNNSNIFNLTAPRMIFDLTAPEGHLPGFWLWLVRYLYVGCVSRA